MHLVTEPPSSEEKGKALLFPFYQDQLLVKTTDHSLAIPTLDDVALQEVKVSRKQYIGIINDHPCYTGELTEDTLPGNLMLTGLRKLFGSIEDDLFWAAGRAFQIMNWSRTHLFCGRCGTSTQNKSNEIAKVCPACGLVNYPSMAPAVIVAVVKDHRILLARNQQRAFKFYSVLAGFVEPGESLEDCVKREVLEEVGITVKNISYFGSQSWPFPNSLMIGFTAQYDQGKIRVDGKEISDAGWFSKDELPEIPGNISISWHLIQWFKKQQFPSEGTFPPSLSSSK